MDSLGTKLINRMLRIVEDPGVKNRIGNFVCSASNCGPRSDCGNCPCESIENMLKAIVEIHNVMKASL